MSKLWSVFWADYSRRLFNWRFTLVTLGPVIPFVLLIGLLILSLASENWEPFGYVDETGLLSNLEPSAGLEAGSMRMVPILHFASGVEARQALENGEIQGYFVLPGDFYQSHRFQFFSTHTPNPYIDAQFSKLIHMRLLESQPAEVARRIRLGPQLDIINTTQDRQTSGNFFALSAPIFGVMIINFLLFSSSGPLLHAFTGEKENRVLEILITSMSPLQLLIGKTLAGLGVGLSSMLVWGVFLAWVCLTQQKLLSFLGITGQVWSYLGPVVVIFSLAFFMVGAFMTAIGVIFAKPSEAMFVGGLIVSLMELPLLFLLVIIRNPSGPLALGFSFFPITAPLAMIIRLTAGGVPGWQLALVVALEAACTAGAVLLAAKAFRASFLLRGRQFVPENFLRRRPKTT